jgi:hypothetical protein
MYLRLGEVQLQLDCAVAGLKAVRKSRSVGEHVRRIVDDTLSSVEAVAP